MKYFQEQFDALLEYRSDENNALRDLRIRAFNDFKETGLPNKKWEEWQFTDFSLIEKGGFRLSSEKDLPPIPKHIPGRIPNTYLIFIINGHYQPKLSEVPNEVLISTGLEHFQSNPKLYSFKNKSVGISGNSNPFVSLNTSMMNSGLPIYIPNNVRLSKPIQIIYLTTELSDALMNHPRFVFHLGERSEATIIEHYIGSTPISYFTNSVTKIEIESNAHLNHVLIQEDSTVSSLTANTDYILHRESELNANSISLGGSLYRHNIKLNFKEKGSSANLNGLSLIENKQHHDQHVIVDHSSNACQSNQLFKYILSDKASGVFNGKVVVKEKTKQTDASQSNKNLVLSPSALMNANPQLEIYADDVKCSHGSTTGQIDHEALFYLRSRGLNKKRAMELIVAGFAGDVIQSIQNLDTKEYVNDKVSLALRRILD